jgi:cell division protein FtsL
VKEKVIRYPVPRRKKVGQWLVLGLIFCFILAGACLCLGQTLNFREARDELARLERKRDMLQEETELLREESLMLHDQEYIEIQARKHLGMVRPGEILFFVGE